MLIHINLLQNQKNYKKLEDFFRLFRIGTVLLAFICFLSLIIIFALKNNAQKAYEASVHNRQMLVDAIQQKEDQEAQIMLIQEKITSMNSILQETPDYSQQIETVLAFMPQASSEGKIKSVATDINLADVALVFPDINALTKFLKIVDSELFQSTFDSIELSTISYTDPNKELDLKMNVGFKSIKN